MKPYKPKKPCHDIQSFKNHILPFISSDKCKSSENQNADTKSMSLGESPEFIFSTLIFLRFVNETKNFEYFSFSSREFYIFNSIITQQLFSK